MHKRILVPVDLENIDGLERALDAAANVARTSDATVVYVNVIDVTPSLKKKPDVDHVTYDLDRFAEAQAAERGIQTDHHVAVRGDLNLHIGKEIIRTAETAQCDLIVMASHVPGFRDHVLSSNAGYVASHAPMSVYVVR